MDKYIPVVVIKELEEIGKILPALKANGINCAEITFRTSCAKDAIKLAIEKYNKLWYSKIVVNILTIKFKLVILLPSSFELLSNKR